MYFGDLTHANQNAHRVIVVATDVPWGKNQAKD